VKYTKEDPWEKKYNELCRALISPSVIYDHEKACRIARRYRESSLKIHAVYQQAVGGFCRLEDPLLDRMAVALRALLGRVVAEDDAIGALCDTSSRLLAEYDKRKEGK
jgi:hypothetical protein